MMRLKVQDFNQYEKDQKTKAVLNVDNNALKAYKLQRKQLSKAFSVDNEIKDLKNEIQEIKNLLFKLINNSTKD